MAVLYAILRGTLVPRATVDARMTEMQQVVVLWKEAAIDKDAVVAELLPLVRQVVENDKVAIALLTALKETADRMAPHSDPAGR